jgi:steroid delta-isomerase-like uncharacterized protein
VMVPDLSLVTEDVVADGDRVAFRSTMRGTPVMAYLGVEPAGRSMTFGAIDIWRIANGRVVEGWHVEDFLRILVEWGAVDLPRRVDADPSSPSDATDAAASTPEATVVVRRWYEAIHRGDQSAIRALLDPDFVNHDPIGPGAPYSPDAAGTIADADVLHATFPDLDVTLGDVFAERATVVARVIVRGTHLGPLLGIPPSGRRCAVMGNEIWRVRQGRIVEHWGRFEELDLLQQLGVLAPLP